MTTTRRGLPSAPLLALLEIPLQGPAADDGPRPGSARWIAERCGVTARTVQRWRSGGTLQPNAADVIATRLGYHPAEIWDDWCGRLEDA